MTYTDIFEELDKRPFEPFRFFITDGTVYDIRQPEQCMVGLTSIVVGVPGTVGEKPYHRMVRIGSEYIVRIEPIQVISKGGNGQALA